MNTDTKQPPRPEANPPTPAQLDTSLIRQRVYERIARHHEAKHHRRRPR